MRSTSAAPSGSAGVARRNWLAWLRLLGGAGVLGVLVLLALIVLLLLPSPLQPLAPVVSLTVAACVFGVILLARAAPCERTSCESTSRWV